ncbi:MAG: hypothetical protein IIB29_18265, partial [Chloroflexi bacterium]|nr:hypothetical protein [Chloroflexota bacterium]
MPFAGTPGHGYHRPKQPSLKEKPGRRNPLTYSGQSIRRFEDPTLITGQGAFVEDFKLPGMLHAAVIRSPYAHARSRSVDTSPASNLPGVVSVLTAN